MEIIPIKTRVLHPPKDDLYAVLDAHLTDVREGDIVVVTSKVVSIHEGRCIPLTSADKKTLIEKESDFINLSHQRKNLLTVVHHAFIANAGIDESNGAGHCILLPQDPFASARTLYRYLLKRFHVSRVGVIVTDSHTLPFRYGTVSTGIGWWGFEPIVNHQGRPDLFGRTTLYSKTNMVDAIAASVSLISGECNEAQPIQIVRDVPGVVWCTDDTRQQLLVPYEEDLYRVLYKDFKPGGGATYAQE
jgi:dihydrofolate synthase / folylpolyglutamate synthase